jgi:hypothetical protein
MPGSRPGCLRGRSRRPRTRRVPRCSG